MINSPDSHMSSETLMSETISHDDTSQIKRAMRVAKAHQAAIGASHRINNLELQQMKVICDQQARVIVSLKQEVADKELQIREINMKFSSARQENVELLDSHRIDTIKGKASLSSLKCALENVEKSVQERYQVLRTEGTRLLKLITGLERHTLHGLHLVPSRTTVNLLLHIRQGLECILSTLDGTRPIMHQKQFIRGRMRSRSEDWSLDDRQPSVSAQSTQKSHLNSRRKSTEATVHTSTKSPAMNTKAGAESDRALLDLCKLLEDENLRLQSSLDQSLQRQGELEQSTAALALIPDYRVALMQAKSENNNMKEQLQQEKSISQTMRGHVELTLRELDQTSAALQRFEGSYKGLRVEIDRIRSERDRLLSDRDRLISERDEVLAEWDRERDRLLKLNANLRSNSSSRRDDSGHDYSAGVQRDPLVHSGPLIFPPTALPPHSVNPVQPLYLSERNQVDSQQYKRMEILERDAVKPTRYDDPAAMSGNAPKLAVSSRVYTCLPNEEDTSTGSTAPSSSKPMKRPAPSGNVSAIMRASAPILPSYYSSRVVDGAPSPRDTGWVGAGAAPVAPPSFRRSLDDLSRQSTPSPSSASSSLTAPSLRAEPARPSDILSTSSSGSGYYSGQVDWPSGSPVEPVVSLVPTHNQRTASTIAANDIRLSSAVDGDGQPSIVPHMLRADDSKNKKSRDASRGRGRDRYEFAETDEQLHQRRYPADDNEPLASNKLDVPANGFSLRSQIRTRPVEAGPTSNSDANGPAVTHVGDERVRTVVGFTTDTVTSSDLEGEVEDDIKALDAKIGQLRSQLESIALIQTQQIVSQVMEATASFVTHDN